MVAGSSGMNFKVITYLKGNGFVLCIAIKHKSPADLEKQLQMGFKEGLTMTLNELEALLSPTKK
jgi:hypothetical protein